MNKEELVANYFSNRLSTEEQVRFQELIDTDAEFKERFEFEKNLQRAITEKENYKLKAKLVAFERDIETNSPKSKAKKPYYYLAIAASLALLVGIAFMLNTKVGPSDYDALYADNFKAYPNTVFAITRSDAKASLKRDAFLAYEAKYYDVAIEKFEQMNSAEKPSYVDFYLAHSYLNYGDTQKAAILFKKVIANEKEFIAESYWYLALSALKNKEKQTAVAALEKLTNTYRYNKAEALQILKEID